MSSFYDKKKRSITFKIMQIITSSSRKPTYLNMHNLQWITRSLSCTFLYWGRKRNKAIKKIYDIRYKRAANDRDKKKMRMEEAGNKNKLKIPPNVLVQSFMQALV